MSEYSLERAVSMAEARHGGMMSAVSFWCDDECLALLFSRCLLVMDTHGHVHQHVRWDDTLSGLHVRRNQLSSELWLRWQSNLDGELTDVCWVIV